MTQGSLESLRIATASFKVGRKHARRRSLTRPGDTAEVAEVVRHVSAMARVVECHRMVAEADGAAPGVDFDAALREIVDRIVKGFSPLKIILFGSRARGTADDDSDVDLLVVTDLPGSRRQQAVAIDLALADIRVAKDVLVVGAEDLERERGVVGTIVYPACREGIVVYDRAA